MSSYASVDAEINAWVDRHQLVLFSSSQGRESRAAYVSSTASETFQIWLGIPQHGQVAVHVCYIDGPVERKPEHELDWVVAEAEIAIALERAMESVLEMMAPAQRYFAPRSDR